MDDTISMNFPKLKLCMMPNNYAICSFPLDATFTDWTHRPSILSITKTSKEITVVCEENYVPGQCTKSENFKCIKVEGSFDLDTVGVLASIAEPLARNEISLYVISTYETDYVLIHAKNIDKAVLYLEKSGHIFIDLKEET